MKNAILASIMLVGMSAMAQNGTAPAAPAAPKATVASAEHKLSRKEAKAECLKENAGLKGKELHKCVKGKM